MPSTIVPAQSLPRLCKKLAIQICPSAASDHWPARRSITQAKRDYEPFHGRDGFNASRVRRQEVTLLRINEALLLHLQANSQPVHSQPFGRLKADTGWDLRADCDYRSRFAAKIVLHSFFEITIGKRTSGEGKRGAVGQRACTTWKAVGRAHDHGRSCNGAPKWFDRITEGFDLRRFVLTRLAPNGEVLAVIAKDIVAEFTNAVSTSL